MVLLGILNSRLIEWFYEKIGKKKGNIFEIATKELSMIPIIFSSGELAEALYYQVNEIISISKENGFMQNKVKQNIVREYERQIDQFVYKLYGLTEEEITIVESSS